MKNLLMLFTLVVFGFSFSACEKQLNMEETVTAKINSPTEASIMNNGNSLNINVTFTDPTELHNYSVILLDETTNTTVLNLTGHTHNTSYIVDSTITLSVANNSVFNLTATGTNHSGETATDVINFTVNL